MHVQGSFECVRSGGARRLESCGPLPRRMRVQANDDSYEATKDRMARTVAAEQSKCTRVIKPNQTDIGRRVKVRSSHPVHSLSTSSAQVPRPAPHSQHPAHQHPQVHPQAHPQAQPQLQSQPHVNSTGPVQAPSQQQPAIRPPPGNPDLARRPIKERLIQLLALKPFKKPELYSRLNSEGIKEKERSVINTILQQISSLKDNCYHLHRHIWNDVNEDWPFYSEEEKRMLKRRDDAVARTRTGTGEDVPASKKQRISHYQQRPAPTGSPSSGYATGGSGSGASSGERQVSDNEDETSAPARSVKKDNGYTLSFGVNTVKDLCSSPVKTNGFSRSSPPVEQTNVTENNITNNEPLENTELTSAPDENNMTDLDKIERQYPPITSSSVRRAYKNEFSELYNEYRELYNSVAAVADVFKRLEQQLESAHPHSPHHQSIEQRIVEEYRKVRNDAAYQRRRRRVNYLHRKLTHIKRMVHEYDQLRARPRRTDTRRAARTPAASSAPHAPLPHRPRSYRTTNHRIPPQPLREAFHRTPNSIVTSRQSRPIECTVKTTSNC
ncbi:RNA polymerase II elongation factor Ell [Eumeta japonica]|uniref:RNA polymerase II elongation factor Ell n=1 Tax=Eumeta variegata TaxID=151549 RepID=A0A4C1XF90_EUMVA|nr:RNA polymerase II elongation factor Ell [Eumeta japonica]